jgi:hypothetical protein
MLLGYEYSNMMILVKFVIGVLLLVIALVNHVVIYSEPEIGYVLRYITKRRVLIYFFLGILALITQCVLNYERIMGSITMSTCQLFGFTAFEIVLLLMNIQLFILSTKITSINLIKPKEDTFYVITSLVAICLLFDKISAKCPCVFITFAVIFLMISLIVLTSFLMKYLSVTHILVEDINVTRHLKLFVFGSMVFGLHGIASFCYPKITPWLVILGICSLLLAGSLLISSIRQLRI